MLFDHAGDPANPAIILLNGSFTTAESMAGIARAFSDEYFVVCPTYDGHYVGGGTFTTRQDQAAKILAHLKEEGVTHVAVAQGASMGAEVMLDFAALAEQDSAVTVDHYYLDGGPFFSFPKPFRALMFRKFNGFITAGKERSPEELLQAPVLKFILRGTDPNLFLSMVGSMPCDVLSEQTVRNETEACYTFDFPPLAEEAQGRCVFSWSSNEPAIRSAAKIRAHYPHATYLDAGKLGHCGFMVREPERYISFIRTLAAS